MHWQVYAWLIIALLLLGAEVLVPGAFLMWLGFAAGATFVLILLFPNMPLLLQVIVFALLACAFVFVYRKWFRDRDHRITDQPSLNRRTAALVGQLVVLEIGISNGRGRVQIADAYWEVSGPDLPAGTHVRIIGSQGMTLLVEPI